MGFFSFLEALAAISAERYGQDKEGGSPCRFPPCSRASERSSRAAMTITTTKSSAASAMAPCARRRRHERSRTVARDRRVPQGCAVVDTVGTLGRRLDPSRRSSPAERTRPKRILSRKGSCHAGLDGNSAQRHRLRRLCRRCDVQSCLRTRAETRGESVNSSSAAGPRCARPCRP